MGVHVATQFVNPNAFMIGPEQLSLTKVQAAIIDPCGRNPLVRCGRVYY